jgi:hypothetical protein
MQPGRSSGREGISDGEPKERDALVRAAAKRREREEQRRLGQPQTPDLPISEQALVPRPMEALVLTRVVLGEVAADGAFRWR